MGLYLFSNHVPINWGWRIGFFIGPVLGLIIIFIRRSIPESPRWLMTHGRNDEAETTVDEIEERVKHQGVQLEPVEESKALEVTQPPRLTMLELTSVFFGQYARDRGLAGHVTRGAACRQPLRQPPAALGG